MLQHPSTMFRRQSASVDFASDCTIDNPIEDLLAMIDGRSAANLRDVVLIRTDRFVWQQLALRFEPCADDLFSGLRHASKKGLAILAE